MYDYPVLLPCNLRQVVLAPVAFMLRDRGFVHRIKCIDFGGCSDLWPGGECAVGSPTGQWARLEPRAAVPDVILHLNTLKLQNGGNAHRWVLGHPGEGKSILLQTRQHFAGGASAHALYPIIGHEVGRQ